MSTTRSFLFILGVIVLCIVLITTILVAERERDHHAEEPTKVEQQPIEQVKVPQSAKPTIIATSSNTFPNRVNSLENPPQRSHWAYVTLISGINEKLSYRGFLYNAIIMYHSLKKKGSKADFIAMIGYNFPMKTKQDPILSSTAYYTKENPDIVSDLNLLRSHGIIVYELPRLLNPDKHPLNFAEMALLKITPYSFTQYEKVQFFDGDILPTENMDCFFEAKYNLYTIGLVSPLNSGWYSLTPNQIDYEAMKKFAIWRLGQDWNRETGWGNPFPQTKPKVLYYRGMEKVVTLWDFNGADMDQGLYTHYFLFHEGHTILIDTDMNTVRIFHEGILEKQDEQYHLTSTSLTGSGGDEERIQKIVHDYIPCPRLIPTDYFLHFTGQSKPWMVLSTVNDNTIKNEKTLKRKQQQRNGRNVILWLKYLDEVKLPVNSTNIATTNFGSPLGFFNANFPKGGYKG
jgi:hypothetical protein